MQIGSSSISTQSLLVDNRRGAATPARRVEAEAEPAERAPRETFRLRAPVAEPMPALGEGLSQQSRTALQSYLSNGPTLAERFGVELAGVDLFV